MLVYCGATTIRDIDFSENKIDIAEKKQVDIVANILGNKLGMKVSKYTSEETSLEREVIKKTFSEGEFLQVLIAIRCLDEGVNIPSIKKAFILASSTNPKEYIQRRGRVLRKFKGKRFAEIYDFITIPYNIENTFDFDLSDLKIVRSLVKKEVERMRDFSLIAMNSSYCDSIIKNLTEIYQLNVIGGDQYDE
jgi:superfamily II DNA or RNA helicase